MHNYLRNIKPDSYFSQFIKQHPEYNPHAQKFLRSLLDAFELRFLQDGSLKKLVFSNILSHIKQDNKGNFQLASLNLYDPTPADKKIMAAVYNAGIGPYWLIHAQTYKAIISRDLAKRQSRISRGVSFRVLEDCIEKIMYNIGVLLVNESMMEEDNADEVCDFKHMFPMIRKALMHEASPEVASQIAEDDRLSQSISFAFYWYYMVSCSFVGPDDPEFPVANTDRDDTWANIQKLLNELPANPTEDQCIVFINRFIDMCHGRGSLAGAFVEGGAATCSAVSNMSADELYESCRYTKQQIVEAIKHWESVLKRMDESKKSSDK